MLHVPEIGTHFHAGLVTVARVQLVDGRLGAALADEVLAHDGVCLEAARAHDDAAIRFDVLAIDDRAEDAFGGRILDEFAHGRVRAILDDIGVVGDHAVEQLRDMRVAFDLDVLVAGDGQLAQRIAVLEFGPLGCSGQRIVHRGGRYDGRFLKRCAERLEHPRVVLDRSFCICGDHVVGRGALLAAHFQHVLVERVLVLGVHDSSLAVRAVAAGHSALLGKEAGGSVAFERDGDGSRLPCASGTDDDDVKLLVPFRVGARGSARLVPSACSFWRASGDAEARDSGKCHACRFEERAAALTKQALFLHVLPPCRCSRLSGMRCGFGSSASLGKDARC